MGFFKKAFRKITRPISKVLDKVIPNEIKPLLPYAAAFAPMLMPTTGFMGSMMGRALLSGGANLGAQLAQEGNEGDFNALSTLLAGGIGALSAPGASEKLRGMRFGKGTEGTQMIQTGPNSPMMVDPNPTAYLNTSGNSFMQNAANSGLGALEKSAKFINTSRDLLGTGGVKPGLNLATLKAAAPAISQGTGDAMYNEAIKAQKQYELDLAEYNQQQDEMMDIPGKSATFLKAYRAYGIDEDTIQDRMEGMDLIYTAPGAANGGIMGYNMGGRVNFYDGGFGGIEAAVQTVKDRDLKENLTIAKDTDMDLKSLAQEFLATYKRQPNSYDELMEFYKKKNGYKAGGEEVVEEQVMKAANGGIMGARVPFVSGGFARGLISTARNTDIGADMARAANAIDEVPMGLVDEMGQPLRAGVDEVVDVSRVTERAGPGLSEFQAGNRQRMGPGMLDYTAAGANTKKAEDFIQAIRTSDGSIDYAIAEERIGRGIKLNGTESIEELIELFLRNVKKDVIGSIALAGTAGAGGVMANAANGGIMGYNIGGSVLPNGVEMDYRGGGFIPMGSKERADDVPARVSKNEFVMTADAVRAAGGGSVNKGAKKMYELMNNLEARA